MCYEETFFRRWARRRAQVRQDVQSRTGRDKGETQPCKPLAPAATPIRKPAKETERETELV